MNFKTRREMEAYLTANAVTVKTPYTATVKKNGVMTEVTLTTVAYEIGGKLFKIGEGSYTTIIGHTAHKFFLVAA